MIDRIADFLDTIGDRPLAHSETPKDIRKALGEETLPEQGRAITEVMEETMDLLFQHSLLTGHPRFWGFIIGSAAPVGALADLLAASINPNVGGWILSPMASEIEAQTVRWIAELIGYPAGSGGLLVSGGNMAHFVGFLTARTTKASWDLRKEGIANSQKSRLRAYVSAETHTWVQKAADQYGLLQFEEELEAFSCHLSITTFRFVPVNLPLSGEKRREYLNELNTALLLRLQASGETFLSNAVVNGIFLLRLCIVNFRTELSDINALPEIVIRFGRELDAQMQ